MLDTTEHFEGGKPVARFTAVTETVAESFNGRILVPPGVMSFLDQSGLPVSIQLLM